MGVYDYISCEYPIDKEVQTQEFQTKSLNCYLDKYKIDKDGQLWILDINDDNKQWEKINTTHDIVFYTFIDGDTNQWYEYRARFKKGKLIDSSAIERIV